jgi:uncharacterized protein YdhG (YjbR/CyaY superfamily)
MVLYFAGWKQHSSLYPVGASRLAAFKDELAAHEVAIGTIRFPLNAPVPVKLIEGIARFSAKNDRPDKSVLVSSEYSKQTSSAVLVRE